MPSSNCRCSINTTAALRYIWPVFAGSGLFWRGAGGYGASGTSATRLRGRDLGDQVCQETADLAEREADEAAARAFGALAAVTAR